MGQRAGNQYTLTAAVMRRNRNERHQRDPKLINTCIPRGAVMYQPTKDKTNENLLHPVQF